MSDKEKVEKENEQFSSSILYVATAVYVGVCAMVFGALYAKLPTFGEAFLVLMKDYGTILAGIPVLVAVVVAKQQLDANRRQHVAMVKRSLKEELDNLDRLREIYRSVAFAENSWSTKIGRISNSNYIQYPKISEEEVYKITRQFPFELRQNARLAAIFANRVNKLTEDGDYKSDEFLSEKSLLTNALIYFNSSIDREEERLSQYWS
ncbi:hypothetical protein [Ochrobactrum chromiisoli]|uniref:Uncharacterized protein n=1 Tax=Ochrobactrum chromiisoli TaxID=2993941 RepID=A0ABT3QM59_9HYPH|nr:hypothetical protein [Ochrobactrum chromiisoli]MCX2696691.1 hypothetical protein [Ochrobactrum chromiisoli]